jgi:signal transduction histidine kinase
LNNIEESKREVLTVATAYFEAKEHFVSLLPSDAEVSFEEVFIHQRVYADDVIIKFVIEQLFSNSYEFREARRPLYITVREELAKDYVCLRIKDNGIGFDSVKYGHDVFGLYKRFHNNAKGKGLGLYFVKEYMRKLKGKVAIESKVGQGTEVRLYFEKVK